MSNLKTDVIDKNLKLMAIEKDRACSTGGDVINVHESDTVIGLLYYLEQTIDELIDESEGSINTDCQYAMFSTIARIKLLLGIPSDFKIM
jgi:hypothetical protein